MVRWGMCPGPICGVQACLHLTSGSWGPGLTQAGAQQGRDTLRVLSSVTVDDDRVQGTETITLQQRHQSLERTRVSTSSRKAGPLLGPRVRAYLVWVPVRRHREVQIGRDGARPPEDRLFSHAQVPGHVKGSAARGRGCETQEAANTHAFPQHLCGEEW